MLVGKEIYYRMVNAFQDAVLQLDGGQRADDAFRHRSQIVADAGDIGSIVSFSHNLSMSDDHQAVLLVGPNGFYEPRQAG